MVGNQFKTFSLDVVVVTIFLQVFVAGGEEIKLLLCPESQTILGDQILKWYPTRAGEMGISNEICVDSNGWVKRQCKLDPDTGEAIWSKIWRKCYARYLTPNLTKNIYSTLVNSYETNQRINISYLRSIWKENKFKFIDLSILVESFNYLPEDLSVAEITDLFDIISSVLNKSFSNNTNYKKVCITFCSIFDKVLNSLKLGEYEIRKPNLYVTAWNPFRNNRSEIIGFYKNFEKDFFHVEDELEFKENLELALYIPWDFLEDLAKSNNSSNLSLVVIVIRNSPIFADFFKFLYGEDVKDFVGVSIPGFCKMNNRSMVRILFNTSGTNGGVWKDFGREYFDFQFGGDNCILSQISYFSARDVGYFESVKKGYCMANTTISNNSLMYWEQTPIKSRAYQDQFCADKNLKILSLRCNDDGFFENDFGFSLECINHTLSNITQHLYNSAVRCRNDVRRSIGEFEGYLHPTYVDVKLYFYLLICLIENDEGILKDTKYMSKVIDKGLESTLKLSYSEPSYVANFFTYFLYATLINLNTEILITNPNFMYFFYKPFKTDIMGLVLYKSAKTINYYVVKALTSTNCTSDYSADDDVEAIVLLREDSIKALKGNLTETERGLVNVTIAVIFKSKFVETEKYECNSKVVVAVTYDSIRNDSEINFFIHIKSNEGDENWGIIRRRAGLSGHVTANTKTLKFIFVSKLRKSLCDATSRITTYYVYKIRSSLDVFKEKIESVDVISKLWIFINPTAEEIYHKHYYILRFIMIGGGSLSILGIFFIILTSLLFKKWREKRPYSLQLSIAIACQTIYFLRDGNHMSHIEYLLFYYFTLSQFSWMLFIGYIQYLRFIKIFKINNPGILTSMVVGWLLPFIITLIPAWLYDECFQCNLCSKNGSIFVYFLIIPLLLVITSNLVIYTIVMISISRSKCRRYGVNISKIRRRAAMLLPFLLGISWIFIFTLIFPWSSVILTGSYLFYSITPLNGFVLFVFIVVGDRSTRLQWINRIMCRMGNGNRESSWKHTKTSSNS